MNAGGDVVPELVEQEDGEQRDCECPSAEHHAHVQLRGWSESIVATEVEESARVRDVAEKRPRAIGQYVRDHGSTVTAFYLSNVEQYLYQDGKQNTFFDNVATLPLTDRSVFIRPYALRRGTSSGLCGILTFLKNAKAGLAPSFNDSMNCN